MKKLLLILTLLFSFSASASQFEFEACDTDMRIRFDDLSEVLWLDIYNTGQAKWDWTVNRGVDSIIKNTETPEQFLQNFLDLVEAKLETYCAENGGGSIPTDWIGQLRYMIENNIEYDATSNSVIIN